MGEAKKEPAADDDLQSKIKDVDSLSASTKDAEDLAEEKVVDQKKASDKSESALKGAMEVLQKQNRSEVSAGSNAPVTTGGLWAAPGAPADAAKALPAPAPTMAPRA